VAWAGGSNSVAHVDSTPCPEWTAKGTPNQRAPGSNYFSASDAWEAAGSFGVSAPCAAVFAAAKNVTRVT
jgi:hypothetical protein